MNRTPLGARDAIGSAVLLIVRAARSEGKKITGRVVRFFYSVCAAAALCNQLH